MMGITDVERGKGEKRIDRYWEIVLDFSLLAKTLGALHQDTVIRAWVISHGAWGGLDGRLIPLMSPCL